MTAALSLDMPIQYLKGVGPRRANAFAGVGIHTVADLLYSTPRAYIERTAQRSLGAIARQLVLPTLFSSERESVSALRSEVSIVAIVERIVEKQFRTQRRLLEAIIRDEDGMRGALLFWNAHQYYHRVLEVGKMFVITGVPELDRLGRVTFTHPQLERVEEEERALLQRGILPIYRITDAMRSSGLTLGTMRRLVRTALDGCKGTLTDILPSAIRERHQLPTIADALEHLHFPPSAELLERARLRMKFEEVFLFELLIALQRQKIHRGIAPVIPWPSPRWEYLKQRLPFSLTAAQERVVAEIARDMASGTPMNRLLQGDVGAGKTLVALSAMLAAVDAGYQTLLAVPTEVLAEQHWRTIVRYTESLNIQAVKLVGSLTPRERQAVGTAIATGQAHIIVGTHALFADSSVRGMQHYHRVGLVVVDEQHRFGVGQRAALRTLAAASLPDRQQPHMLVMSATPIPRTLTMTLYGELDVSLLDEMPPGRQPVRTCVIGYDHIAMAYEHIRSEISAGRQAFIVYPLVEESERVQLRAATSEYERLSREQFPMLRVGLIHGQMSWNEKEQIMHQFATRQFDILVATTVIEVGIDVPNATVMLIEHAERFGLAQLHQLRGRVGRGPAPATCYLVTEPHIAARVHAPPTDDEPLAATRLRTMEQTTNGFLIAEADLRLRGPGDVLGTRQTGMPEFRYVDITRDAEIIAHARSEAFTLTAHDPHLRLPAHATLRQHILRQLDDNSLFAVA